MGLTRCYKTAVFYILCVSMNNLTGVVTQWWDIRESNMRSSGGESAVLTITSPLCIVRVFHAAEGAVFAAKERYSSGDVSTEPNRLRPR